MWWPTWCRNGPAWVAPVKTIVSIIATGARAVKKKRFTINSFMKKRLPWVSKRCRLSRRSMKKQILFLHKSLATEVLCA